MPTYTILGATGKTGGALLQLLLKTPNTHIKAYVRSKAKLLHQNPNLEQNDRVQIFEGPLSNIPLIASALSPKVDTAFCVLGINENTPGIRIAQDTAHSVVAALCHIMRTRNDANYKPPKLIVLSSASLNPRFGSAVEHAIIGRALSNLYGDLALAERYLRLHESWLRVTFVQPGGLTGDVQRGHRVSLEACSPMVSYLDLAAGMIEIAEAGDVYDWEGVSVRATGKNVRFERNAPGQIARGFLWHFVPSLYWMCRYLRIVS